MNYQRRSFLFLLAASAAVPARLRAAAPESKPGPALTDDLSALRKVDPALKRWTEQAPIRLELPDPAGLAIAPDGTLVVVGGRVLRRLAPDGAVRASATLEEPARCVAVAPDGDVLVGFARQVAVFGADLKPKAEGADLGETALVASVAAAADAIYVADAGQKALWKFDRGGRLLGRLGERDPAKGVEGFLVPSPHMDVGVGADGTVWVVNPGRAQLESYTPDGTPGRRWGKQGFGIDAFCGCCNPTDFARLPDGSFVTSEKGLERVKVLTADGALVSVVAAPDDFDEGVSGLDLAVDATGRVLVLDPKRKQIRVFAKKEKTVTSDQ